MYLFIKFIITALVVVGVSEVAKKYSTFAAMLAALPLTSILAFIWLYIDTREVEKVVELSYGIFWLVLPTLLFFIIFPFLLKSHLNFWLSLVISIITMIVFYAVYAVVIKKFGIGV